MLSQVVAHEAQLETGASCFRTLVIGNQPLENLGGNVDNRTRVLLHFIIAIDRIDIIAILSGTEIQLLVRMTIQILVDCRIVSLVP